MKRTLCRISRAIQLSFLLCIAIELRISAQGFSPATISRLQFIIDSFQNNNTNSYIGGLSAAINVDGLASWQGASGFAARNVDGQNNLLPGGTPFTTSTHSRMYSVTKTFTSALALELAKGGAFSLEDPVSKFLPLNLINQELNSTVTIRQLLAHESGYSNYTDELQLQIAVAFQPTHVWTPFEMLSFVHQIAAPGSERRYSSTNYITLGAIIEAATGKPIEKHYRERFFEPLHLRSMFLGVREPLPNTATLASPHDNLSPFNPVFQLTGQPTFPDAYTNVSAFPFTAIVSLAFTGGGIVSNVADMAEWGNALFGGRATSRSTINTMLNSISSTPDPDGDFLGYGIFRTTRISATDVFIGHDGNAPGYRSVMFYQPDKKMTIAILTNYHGAKLYDVAKALYESMPEFTCGNKNRKEDKIIVCFNGHNLCVGRYAAAVHIRRGAWLGGCKPKDGSQGECKPVVETKGQMNNRAGMKIFPNPSSNHASVSFKVAKTGKASIGLYDLNGKLLSTIFNGFIEEGIMRQAEIKTAHLPAGTYLIRLQSQNTQEQQKLVVIK